jgi:hypothetical protein
MRHRALDAARWSGGGGMDGAWCRRWGADMAAEQSAAAENHRGQQAVGRHVLAHRRCVEKGLAESSRVAEILLFLV